MESGTGRDGGLALGGALATVLIPLLSCTCPHTHLSTETDTDIYTHMHVHRHVCTWRHRDMDTDRHENVVCIYIDTVVSA